MRLGHLRAQPTGACFSPRSSGSQGRKEGRRGDEAGCGEQGKAEKVECECGPQFSSSSSPSSSLLEKRRPAPETQEKPGKMLFGASAERRKQRESQRAEKGEKKKREKRIFSSSLPLLPIFTFKDGGRGGPRVYSCLCAWRSFGLKLVCKKTQHLSSWC
ncbi:hypothetical protein TGRH88_078150 [Toxoplasma gondii]|uniref:Uncharacterized protein n=1 Tax=Toxoplasma gondii TaxID=5811 RepID=A0A7J6K3F4_TOXGO|nr:hypothetical protein TGRH88_078150 [Toxoplasma gondii]